MFLEVVVELIVEEAGEGTVRTLKLFLYRLALTVYPVTAHYMTLCETELGDKYTQKHKTTARALSYERT